MNRIITLTFYLLFLNSFLFAQEGVVYKKVVEVENATKEELFVKARYWFTDIFEQSDKQLNIEDKEKGRLLARSSFLFRSSAVFVNEMAEGEIEYSINIEIKDGSYTYTIADFNHFGNVLSRTPLNYGFIYKEDLCTDRKPKTTSKKRMKKICVDLKEQIDKEVNKIIKSLGEKMKVEDLSKIIKSTRPNGIVYSDFLEIEQMSKAQIYEKIRLWFARSFANSNEILELEDKELGELFGKSSMFYKSRYFGRDNTIGDIWYQIRIQVKDNGYQFTISDFEHVADPNNEVARSYGFITSDDICYGNSKRKKLTKQKRKTCEELKEIIDQNVMQLKTSLQYAIEEIEEKELVADQVFEGEILFSKVVVVPNRTQEVLFRNGRTWLRSFMVNSNDKIEIQDEEAGEFYVKNFIKYNPPLLKGGGLTTKGEIWYDLRIQVREGEYKFTVSNFDHVASPFLETPISFGNISSNEICFNLKNVGLTKKRKRKFCNYINKCIAENMIALEKSLEEMMQRK